MFEINKNKVMLYLFPLINYWGYSFRYTDLNVWKALQFVVIPLVFFYAGKKIYKAKSAVSKNVRLILILALMSIIMSYLVHGQSILLGYRVTAGFLTIVFYFFLQKADFEIAVIEKFVIFYGILWICLWLINLFSPVPLFGLFDADKLGDSRGIIRFFIQGDGFLYMVFFLFFNKWLSERKTLFLVLAITSFVIIVFQVTRQTIAFSALVALYYFVRKNKFFWVYLLIAGGAFFFVDIDVPKDSIIGKMLDLSISQYKDNSSGTTDVRIDEYKYFFSEYTDNLAAVFLGNGLPHVDSEYGRAYVRLKLTKKYFYSDVGYAGIYIMMGVVGLFVFLRFFVIIAKKNILDRNNLWAKMFVCFLFLCNAVSFVISVNIIPMVTALYVIDKDFCSDKRGLK